MNPVRSISAIIMGILHLFGLHWYSKYECWGYKDVDNYCHQRFSHCRICDKDRSEQHEPHEGML